MAVCVNVSLCSKGVRMYLSPTPHIISLNCSSTSSTVLARDSGSSISAHELPNSTSSGVMFHLRVSAILLKCMCDHATSLVKNPSEILQSTPEKPVQLLLPHPGHARHVHCRHPPGDILLCPPPSSCLLTDFSRTTTSTSKPSCSEGDIISSADSSGAPRLALIAPPQDSLLPPCLPLQETAAPGAPHWRRVQAHCVYHIRGT